MKRPCFFFLAAVLSLCLSACGESATEQTTSAPPKQATSTDHITINGLCVDDSYRDSDNSPLRLVYLFYTLTATDTNLEIDSNHTTMIVGDTNRYESEHLADTASACAFLPNYYYSSYIEDVYTGESLNVTATFYLPEGDLAPGKIITLEDSQLPAADLQTLRLSTDEIQHFNSGEEMAKAIDPDGYTAALKSREEADSTTANKVKSQINGHSWSVFLYNAVTTRISFSADNHFTVSSSLGTSNSGTYSVRNNYIVCTYANSDNTVEIPYSWEENGEIDLDVIAAFDVKA